MMDIRPYDIVEFNGEQYRVMSVRPYIMRFVLPHMVGLICRVLHY